MDEKKKLSEARDTYERLKKKELTEDDKKDILAEINEKEIGELLYLKQIADTELAVSEKPVASIWPVIISLCALVISIITSDEIFNACSEFIVYVDNKTTALGCILYGIGAFVLMLIILAIAIITFHRSKSNKKAIFIKNAVDVRLEILEKNRTKKPQKNNTPKTGKDNDVIVGNNNIKTPR